MFIGMSYYIAVTICHHNCSDAMGFQWWRQLVVTITGM